MIQNENDRNELNSNLNIVPTPELNVLCAKISNVHVGSGAERLLQRPRENDLPVAVAAATTNQLLYRPIMPSSRFQQAFSEIVQPKVGHDILRNLQTTTTTAPASSSFTSSQRLPPIAKPHNAPPLAKSSSFKLKALPDRLSSSPGEETPQRRAALEFKTPSVEYTAQRPRLLSRFPLNSSKTKSSLNSEFESKKIVFTTPSTVSCPPPLPSPVADLSIDGLITGVLPLPSVEPTSSTLSLFSDSSATPSPENVLQFNGKRFFIEKKIGAGGSSVVYLTKKCDTKEQVAVKVVDLQGDAAVIEGYVNETKLLAKLQGDESVIRLFE